METLQNKEVNKKIAALEEYGKKGENQCETSLLRGFDTNYTRFSSFKTLKFIFLTILMRRLPFPLHAQCQEGKIA